MITPSCGIRESSRIAVIIITFFAPSLLAVGCSSRGLGPNGVANDSGTGVNSNGNSGTNSNGGWNTNSNGNGSHTGHCLVTLDGGDPWGNSTRVVVHSSGSPFYISGYSHALASAVLTVGTFSANGPLSQAQITQPDQTTLLLLADDDSLLVVGSSSGYLTTYAVSPDGLSPVDTTSQPNVYLRQAGLLLPCSP